MKNKLAKLIDVKSIITILMSLLVCYLAIVGTIVGEQVVTIYTVIIGFYFGTQSQKKAGDDNATIEERKDN